VCGCLRFERSCSVGYAGELCDLGRSHGRWWPPRLGWGKVANRVLCFNYSLSLGLILRKTTENFSQGRRKLLGRPWFQPVRFQADGRIRG